ncbi:MAG: MFS transporter [Dehalococcoidia bacterium]|nr:MFS transporter [Dehalococcoidia bacterium]
MRHPLAGASPGWLVVAGAALVLFGAAGSRFSFGVFLTPLTEDFGWSRSSMSGALAVAGLATAFLRPVAGYLSDRFDPVKMALIGMAMAGLALLGLSQINQLWQLYTLFLIMGSGFTLASPATLTRLISSVFTKRRSLALSLAGSGSAIGETTLVPISAVVLTLGGWRSAYIVLSMLVLVVIIPVSYRLLKSKFVPEVDDRDPAEITKVNQKESEGPACAWAPDQGMSLKQAARTPIFWALTFGFFT